MKAAVLTGYGPPERVRVAALDPEGPLVTYTGRG
jgi:hypothetical protein